MATLLQTPVALGNISMSPPPICSTIHTSQPFVSTSLHLRVLATLPSPLSPIVLDGGFMLRFSIAKVSIQLPIDSARMCFFF